MVKNKKKMSVIQLTIITAVNMMGSGIIMLPSKLAQVGTMSVISWLVTLTGALCLAYVFARCGMFTKNTKDGMGGYAEYAFGMDGNMMANYTYAFSLVIANTAIAVSTVGYGEMVFGVSLSPVKVAIATMLVLVVATIANFWGARVTGQLGSITVWGVIIPVIFLCIGGWFWFHGHTYTNAWNPHHYTFFKGVSQSIPITLWAFLGLESASANSDAVENPKKNVPIACLGGTIIAGVIYIASTNIAQGIVRNNELAHSNAPFGTVFTQMFNPTIGAIVMALLTISCFGSLLTWQFTVAEVFRSSALAGYFPKWFVKQTKHDAPVIGMMIILCIQLLLSLMTISPNLNAQFNNLVNLAVVTNMVPYILSMAAVKTLQLSSGIDANNRAYRVTNVVGVIAGIYSLYSMYACGNLSLALGALVAFAGWTIYGFVADKYNVQVN